MTFLEWELLEYSSVSVPANQDALNEAKKLVKTQRAKDLLYTKPIIKNNNDEKILKELQKINSKLDETDPLYLKELVEMEMLKLKHQNKVQPGKSNLAKLDLSQISKEIVSDEVSKITGK